MGNKYLEYILCSILLAVSSFAKADGISNLSLPPSPDAAALGKYGQYPVSLYNGLVGISIPIYTIKLRNFELPISLSYHASGIKVDEISSCVGLGWALQAGGVITRSVRGLPDNPIGNGLAGIRYTQDQVQRLGLENYISYLSERYRSEIAYSDDTESDVFFYNVGNISGSFRFDTQGNLIQIPLTNNKIEYDGTNFTITGNDGTVYAFQNKETSFHDMHFTVPAPGSSFQAYTSSWYLSYILTADKQEIDFEYDTDNTQYTDFYETSSVAISHKKLHINTVRNQKSSHTSNNSLLLSKITFPGGSLRFRFLSDRQDCRNNRLSKIEITNNMSYTLEHSYFNSHGCKRLKLDTIKLLSNSNDSIGKYHFDYNTTVSLPPYLSENSETSLENQLHRGQDIWGYYNGVTTNKHMLVCNNYNSNNISQADRSVNPHYAEANILTRITYPTGGSTQFVYEGNKSENGTLLGGLRIKNVISYNGGNLPSTIRSYEYQSCVNRYMGIPYASHCHSQTESMLVRYDRDGNKIYFTPNDPNIFFNEYETFDYYSSNPSIPLSYNDGSPVYYKKVTEYEGYPNNCNGKTVYSYMYQLHDIDYAYNNIYYTIPTTVDPGMISSLIFIPNYEYVHIDRSWTRGLLDGISIYSKINNEFVLKKRTRYKYSMFNNQRNIVGFHAFANYWPHIEVSYPTNFPPVQELFQYTDVIAETGLMKLTEVSDSVYEGNQKLATTTRHFYDNLDHQYEISRTYQTNSDGSVIKKSFTYPKDYNSGIYSMMVQRNMLNQVIETRDSIDNSFLKLTKTSYGYWQNSFIAPIYISERQFNGESRNIFCYQNYGPKGNPISVVNEKGENTVYLWGYNYLYPIAEIRNATYTEVVNAIQGGDSAIESLAISNEPNLAIVDALRQSLPNALITTCTYKPLVGMLSRTEPNGITTFYIYDNAGRLSRIWNNRRETVKGFEYNYVNK